MTEEFQQEEPQEQLKPETGKEAPPTDKIGLLKEALAGCSEKDLIGLVGQLDETTMIALKEAIEDRFRSIVEQGKRRYIEPFKPEVAFWQPPLTETVSHPADESAPDWSKVLRPGEPDLYTKSRYGGDFKYPPITDSAKSANQTEKFKQATTELYVKAWIEENVGKLIKLNPEFALELIRRIREKLAEVEQQDAGGLQPSREGLARVFDALKRELKDGEDNPIFKILRTFKIPREPQFIPYDWSIDKKLKWPWPSNDKPKDEDKSSGK